MTAFQVYVAASWSTPLQPVVVSALRFAGFTVYDFRNPPNGAGFGWEQVTPKPWQEWTLQELREALAHPVARDGFYSDLNAVNDCKALVLLQPSGRSAALELGYAAGLGKPCAVLAVAGEKPELMFKVAEYITDDLHSLISWLHEEVDE